MEQSEPQTKKASSKPKDSPDKKEKKKRQPPESKTYIGPPFSNGRLRQFVTFRNGLPEWVQELAKETPVLKLLFVDTKDLPRVIKALRDASSPESALINQVRGEL